jgi:hypothetical protein
MCLLGNLHRAPVFDMSELENLFSAVLPSSDSRRTDKSGNRASGSKPEKIHLVSCFTIIAFLCTPISLTSGYRPDLLLCRAHSTPIFMVTSEDHVLQYMLLHLKI